MKKNLTLLVILLFCVSFAAAKDNPYVIGVILPQTGNLGFMGEMETDALQLAMEEINIKTHTWPHGIKLLFGDSRGDAKEAVSLAQKFVAVDKVNALWTSLTGVSYAVEPIATKNKILHIAFCMDPDIAKKSQFVFRLYQGMNEEGEILVDYLRQKPSTTTVGILYVRIPATEALVHDVFNPGIQKQGKQIVFSDSYEFNNKEFQSLLAKAYLTKPDVLILYDYGFSLPMIFDSLNVNRLLGKTQILGGWGFLYSLISHNLDPMLLDDIVVATPPYMIKRNKTGNDFFNKFKAKFSKEPNFDAGYAYMSMLLLETALRNAKSYDVNKVASNLLKIKMKDSVMGDLIVSPQRELKISLTSGIIKGGQVVPLQSR